MVKLLEIFKHLLIPKNKGNKRTKVKYIPVQYNVTLGDGSNTVKIFSSGRNAHGFAKRLERKTNKVVYVYKVKKGNNIILDPEEEEYQGVYISNESRGILKKWTYIGSEAEENY